MPQWVLIRRPRYNFAESRMYEVMISSLETSNADISMCGLIAESSYSAPASISAEPVVYQKPMELLLDSKIGTGYIWNKVFRREAIGNVRLDESIVYSEDQLFIVEVLFATTLAVVVPQVFYHYMQRQGSLSWQDGNYEIWQGNFRARQLIYKMVIEKSSDKRLQQYAFSEYVKAIFALLRYTIKYRDKDEYNRIIKTYKSDINEYVHDGPLTLGKKIEYSSYSNSYRVASLIHYYPKHIR